MNTEKKRRVPYNTGHYLTILGPATASGGLVAIQPPETAAREYFIEFCCRDSFKLYFTLLPGELSAS